MSQIFISYGHEDTRIAEGLYEALRQAGHAPWLAKRDLRVGDKWAVKIEDEIHRADYFIILLSSRSFTRRGYLQKELSVALDILAQTPINQRFIIPVRLDDCEVDHPALRQLHWLDLHSEGIEALLQGLSDKKTVPTNFYADIGLLIPPGVMSWSDEKLFSWIRETAFPEAFYRAQRDYPIMAPWMPERDYMQLLRERATEKVAQMATEHGFTEGWLRYKSDIGL